MEHYSIEATAMSSTLRGGVSPHQSCRINSGFCMVVWYVNTFYYLRQFTFLSSGGGTGGRQSLHFLDPTHVQTRSPTIPANGARELFCHDWGPRGLGYSTL